jgi:iron-sulfur cluster assembly accessory protein
MPHGGGGCCGGNEGHGEAHGHEAAAAPVQAPSRFSGQIGVSDLAASKLKGLMEGEKKDPAVWALRIGVQGGGCSGMTYFMDFDEARADDKVFASGGVRVVVDPKSILHLSGSVLDYSEGLMGSGFTIKNPNAKSSCGCGSSFNT